MEFRPPLVVLVAPALASLPAPAGGGETVSWTTESVGAADLRRAEFAVLDPDCAYSTLADSQLMQERMAHLEGVVIHREAAGFQDLTLTERFFPIGLVHSRYHRTFDGVGRVEWRLIEGSQARHDGVWIVTRNADGSGHVLFQNLIQAKSLLHKPLLKRVQVRTMEAIVRVVQETCVQS